MTGGEVDGVNWCPYCVTAKPFLEEYVLSKTKLTVLKGLIYHKTDWVGVKTHPYRTHPILKAGSVPYLVLVDGDSKQVLARAVEEEDFANPELLTMIACEDE